MQDSSGAAVQRPGARCLGCGIWIEGKDVVAILAGAGAPLYAPATVMPSTRRVGASVP